MRVFLLQNFLFTSKDENSPLKAIDFGLSDYVKPGQDYYLRFISLITLKKLSYGLIMRSFCR